ncbi:rhamnan synthesis F family protein [Rhodopila sp.]|uniref:rhamnan synthesis F family protein n=1 Tax=Rhodopila sp. TaxID=2480087 RepID=UPI003D0FC7D4
MTEPLRLTELDRRSSGLRRVAHGYAASGKLSRLVYRGFVVAGELIAALPRDAVHALRRGPTSPPRIETGTEPKADATSIALYVHYSTTGRVSAMVLDQLGFLRQSGFAIVFISMAARIPEADWQAVRQVCALLVQRENFGRDFGAWHDLIPEVRRRWPSLTELMLVNDSVLGPIHPLGPVLDALRTGGAGLFGLTESVQGGAHLQSYMLLARGGSAAADLMAFVQSVYVSHSKWLLVQLGEVRLARWMRRRGHRVAALFGYDRLIAAALSDPGERVRLTASHAKLRDLDRLSPAQATELLHAWPLNPTHHLWHVLATRFGYPFLKTELILRNPGRIPDVADWINLVPPDSPCPLAELQAHLATMASG